jgi:glucokinase
MKIVGGDIGGTKTLLQCVDLSGPQATVLAEQKFPSERYVTFSDLFREFLLAVDGPVDCACFAVAGPVVGEEAHLTNLKWILKTEMLEKEFGIRRVRLVNDFYAVAAGIPHLKEEDLISINPGSRDRGGALAILGAGTGLGEAFVVPVEGKWRVVPSEGGHCDFAPVTEEQERLLTALRERFGRVSYERVLSGRGLVNILTFLQSDHAILSEPEDQQPEGVALAASTGDAAAMHAMELFAEIYGAEAGNLALKVVARGGVYLAGGIAGKNLRWLQDGRFTKYYGEKGRFSDLVRSIPVDVIANARVGLIGAMAIAEECVAG